MQHFGCEQCGASSDALQPQELASVGEPVASAMVHLHKSESRSAPFVVGLVKLDAFTIEELEHIEHMGLCKPGRAVSALKAGEFHIGGRGAVNASGGLIGMAHPIGPTGIGQIAELTRHRQLRGEAGPRQHPDARIGLAHMVGVGAVCYVHVLQRPA